VWGLGADSAVARGPLAWSGDSGTTRRGLEVWDDEGGLEHRSRGRRHGGGTVLLGSDGRS
jgi:hypothetical protein